MEKYIQSSLAQVLNLSGIELEKLLGLKVVFECGCHCGDMTLKPRGMALRKHVLVSELRDSVTLSDIEGLGWDVAFERKGGMLLMYRIME